MRPAATARAASSRWCCIRKPWQQDDGNAEAERVLRLLLAELPLKSAVRLAAEISGAPRNALYDTALRLRDEPND